MANSGTEQLEVQLDTTELQESVAEVNAALEGLEGQLVQVGAAIERVFAQITGSVKSVDMGMDKLNGTVGRTFVLAFSSLTEIQEKLKTLSDEMNIPADSTADLTGQTGASQAEGVGEILWEGTLVMKDIYEIILHIRDAVSLFSKSTIFGRNGGLRAKQESPNITVDCDCKCGQKSKEGQSSSKKEALDSDEKNTGMQRKPSEKTIEQSAVEILEDATEQAMETAADKALDKAKAAVSDLGETVQDAARDSVSEALEDAKPGAIIADVVDDIGDAVAAAGEAAASVLPDEDPGKKDGGKSDMLGVTTAVLGAFGIDTEEIIASLVSIREAFAGTAAAQKMSAAATWLQNAAVTAWQGICGVATAVTTAFGAAVSFLTSPIGLVMIAITALIAIIVLLVSNWDNVKDTVLNVWSTIQETLCNVGTWVQENVLTPLVNGFKGVVNGIIGFINGLIAGAVDGINNLISIINSLQFDVPEWVPVIGGSVFGFDIPSVKAPQIPYLAKGAVLPANRPFLAMVGDQRHGTNVEAPLSTIQEAVALVMEDHTAANLAGQEAIVTVLRQILTAVLGIELGDDVLGQAVQRYERKMAVVKGGF